ncbi:helix-turn-helix transcriptional regulator [Vibrio sp. H11]|uniref:helix-turn-helix transcriptional regulator n=1 Tax=Vibrio sp. H11 TaxID=2565928 RepID=UPI0010A63B51|nr:helix-turn-helix transcriptional regulator [Vibrio sp. H11]
MNHRQLIKALVERRKSLGITQAVMAKKVGLSLKTYQRVEQGETDMKLSTYKAMIDELNITDLDVALDLIGIDGATPWDVAAAARVLPPDVRTVLVSLIMMIHRHGHKG